jgi:mannose-1-phosphate guanylyltransferase/mannose-1-phosphate guanylyltransferase/mannose-6-phosphate isomerase
MFKNCLIMAGGSGTRLWPASNSKKPKQFLSISKENKDTFFSLSIERALNVIDKDSGKIIIICGKAHLPFIIEECKLLSIEDKKRIEIIPEPEAKSTAPAIACTVMYLRKENEQKNNMLVITSDHIIKTVEIFRKDAAKAANYTKKDNLVVFGIMPSRPETGYGYINAERELSEEVHTVDTFMEKPDQKTAEKLLASKRYYWNSGMFAFNCNFIVKEFRKNANKVIQPFEKLNPPDEKAYTTYNGIKVLDNWTGLDNAYRQTEKISFDNAIAEKCTRTVMVKAAFEWNDVGDWDEYARLLSNDSLNGSFGNSEVYTAGTCEGCFVNSDIPVALAGVKDLIIVIRSGKDGSAPSALIARKGETQQVKDIVEKIKKAGKIEML